MGRTDREALARDLLDALGEAGAGELEAVMAALDVYSAPAPAPAATAALIERLRAYVPAPDALPRRRFRAEGLASSPLTVMWGLLTAQARLFGLRWWLLTLLLALPWPYAAREMGAPLALIAPPLVALGIAHAFRASGTPAAEMELSCPIRPAHLVLARVLLVMGWVTLLGLSGAALGAPAGALLTWAAGTLLFGGAALALTLWVGPRGALGLGLVAWVALLLVRGLPTGGEALRPLWGMTDSSAAVLGAALCALSLALASRLFRPHREEA